MTWSILTFRKWHRWIGWAAALFFLSVSITGILLQSQQLFGQEEAEKERLRTLTSAYTVGGALTKIHAALANAQASVRAVAGDAPLDRVVLNLKGDHPTIALLTGGAKPQQFTVNANNGVIERIDTAEEESFLLRLHTGEVLGDGGVVLGLLWGVAMLIMTLTGLYIYLKMRRANNQGLKRVFWMAPLWLLIGPKPDAHAEQLSGQYLATGNVSTLSEPLLSLNNRLTLNYAPMSFPGNFDARVEFYNEPSFHSADHRIVTEHKREIQLNYSYPLVDHLSLIVGYLYHANRTFRDDYYWAIAGLSLSGDVAANTPASISVLAEKRDKSSRIFYDYAGSVEHKFRSRYGIVASAHIYQNMGEFDLEPTHKREYEVGVNWYPSGKLYAGLSYFKHTQVDDPDDRFDLVKFKVGVNF